MAFWRVKQYSKSTAFRLAALYSTIFILSCGVLFLFAYILISSIVEEQDHSMIRLKMNEYLLMEQAEGMDALLREIRQEDSSNKVAGFFVRIADPLNSTLFCTSPRRFEGVEGMMLRTKQFEKPDEWIILQGKKHKYVLDIDNRRLSNGYWLQVGRGSKKRRILLRNFREIFALAMIPVVLIGIAAGAFLAFRSLRPIRDLINTVSDIEAGKMDARVPYRGTGDELDELARLFNKMLERIKSLIDRMQDTLDDVAHDLKTPVTRLRNVIETTLQSRCDRETLREALMDCAEESERIVAMLETLMDISEAEAGTIALNIEEVQIESLIRDVVELYEYVAEEKGVEIMFQACATLVARVDPNRIRQVISNLLDNAVKYTSKGGMIEIRSDKKDDGIMISIKDTGTGIPRKELPRIFDRLYRGDKSRSSRGIGLGLSLVKAVIHAHKGRIEVESHPGMGSCFTIYLPSLRTYPTPRMV